MSNSAWPHRRQPTRLPRPWDPPGKNTGVGCHFLLQCIKVKSESEVTQSCPTLSDPMDCSPPDSSVHGIFQARVLEWGATAFSNVCTRDLIKVSLKYMIFIPILLNKISSKNNFYICVKKSYWSRFLKTELESYWAVFHFNTSYFHNTANTGARSLSVMLLLLFYIIYAMLENIFFKNHHIPVHFFITSLLYMQWIF